MKLLFKDIKINCYFVVLRIAPLGCVQSEGAEMYKRMLIFDVVDSNEPLRFHTEVLQVIKAKFIKNEQPTHYWNWQRYY